MKTSSTILRITSLVRGICVNIAFVALEKLERDDVGSEGQARKHSDGRTKFDSLVHNIAQQCLELFYISFVFSHAERSADPIQFDSTVPCLTENRK